MLTWSLIPASAVVPSLLLMWYFHARDLFREPAKVLWATFGLGVAITVPVIVVVLPVTKLVEPIPDPYLRGFIDAFVLAAIPEECFKFLVIRFYCARHKEFDEPMDGIVYGAAASLGFATLENVLYVTQHGMGTAILRALTAVPNHAFLGALMGYWVGQARFNPGTGRHIFKALFIPILLHGLYDFPLLSARTTFAGAEAAPSPSMGLIVLLTLVPVILLVEWIWVVKLVRRLRRAQEALLRSMQMQAQAPAGPQVVAPPVQPAPQPVQPAQPALARPAAPPQRRGGGAARFWGWFLVVVGGLHAVSGGLITLGGLVGVAMGKSAAGEMASAVLGLVIVGVIPLGLGVLMFGFGLRLLNRSYR